MVKYRLVDGSIVDAERECDCLPEIHGMDEPHWLYMDRLWHEKNRKFLENAKENPLACMAFYKEESARLLWLESEFRHRGIQEIIRE